jgi:subtilisin family serine protease
MSSSFGGFRRIYGRHGIFQAMVGLAMLFVAAGASAAPRVVADRILMKPRADTDDRLRDLIAGLGASEVERIVQIDVRILKVPSAQRDRILQALARSPVVEFAEADEIMAPGFTPNDPSYRNQWHHAKITTPTAWDATPGDPRVIVAICDTGVDSAHPDLAANIVPGWNFYDNNANTSDVYGHGTKVAGVVAAAGNNGIGVAGVAFQCRIMPLRISALDGSASTSAMAKAVTYAADHGARVANISYMATKSSTVTTAAKYLESKGGVLTISSGNYSTFDAAEDNPHVLTVSATTSSDGLASFSNTGNNVDLAAPGSGIYTTARAGAYTSVSGTSFSAPCVAGVVALVLSANPMLTGQQAQSILKAAADDLGASGWDPQYGYGRVNASRAVAAALSGGDAPDLIPPQVTIESPADGAIVSGVVAVIAPATDNVGVVRLDLYLDGALAAQTSDPTDVFLWNTAGVSGGMHAIQVAARDAAGNVARAGVMVQVANLPDMTAPSAQILSPADSTVVSRNVKVTVLAEDDVEVTRLELYVNGVLLQSTSGSSLTCNWNTSKLPRGTHVLHALAEDAAGNLGISPTVTVIKR